MSVLISIGQSYRMLLLAKQIQDRYLQQDVQSALLIVVHEEVSRNNFELAADPFLLHSLFHGVDGNAMALTDDHRYFKSVR